MNYDRQFSKLFSNMAKRVPAHIRSHFHIPLDPILIVEFLRSFKLTVDTNGVYKVAAMWLFHFHPSDTSSEVLSARLCPKSTDEINSRSVVLEQSTMPSTRK